MKKFALIFAPAVAISLLIILTIQVADSKELIQQQNVIITDIQSKNDILESANIKLHEKTQKLEEEITTLHENEADLTERLRKEEEKNKKLKEDYKALEKKLKAATAAKPAVMPSRGSTARVDKVITVSATAYTAYCAGCSGITKTGVNLRKNPGTKVIAVDPRIIPLGTKVYVEGYGYAVAADTGGAIKGHKIDVFIPTKSEAFQWGRKQVQVRILGGA